MKTVGFIDYYLDEFHANKYPGWIETASQGSLKVEYAYAHFDSPNPDGLTTEGWCEKNGIIRLNSIEELVEKSDCINVLSPDNPEMHEQLCALALRSGKPVYVDKTFAETAETAKRIFSIAEESGTPCFSSSALRFATEFSKFDRAQIEHLTSFGPGFLDTYSIHQIEPIIMLLGKDVTRLQYTGTPDWPSLVLVWKDGRSAEFSHHGWDCPFGMHIDQKNSKSDYIEIQSDFFESFIQKMVDFFQTGDIKVPHEETIAVIAVREAALKASLCIGEWIPVNR